MESHRLALPAGYRLENYEIQEVLGKGGFGVTYVAYDWTLKRHMAIKELLPDTIATRVEGSSVVPHSVSHVEDWEWARQRFLEEAQILAGFDHPNIVRIHRLIEAHGTVYMVMDHLPSESYDARLKRIDREPDEASLKDIILPILDGLKDVHAAGLLHRDIKPENILFDRRNNPVLIDFGAARESIGQTIAMTSIVTHGYSPIEQYQSKGRMGPWTDIYALAALMCRAITGEKPPVAADRIVEDEYIPLSQREGLDNFSKSFLSAVDEALEVRAENRPKTIEEWEARMCEAKTNPISVNAAPTPVSQPRVSSPVRAVVPVRATTSGLDSPFLSEKPKDPKLKTNRLMYGVGALVIGIVILAGVFLLTSSSPEEIYNQATAEFKVAETSAEGLKLLRTAAERGHAEAQFDLAWRYDSGNGLTQNPVEAAKWFKWAAEQGHVVAQHNVGWMYENGEGVPQDPAEAVKWYRLAADQGDIDAQFKLGLMYAKGELVKSDPVEATKLFRLAADQGDAAAQNNLGLFYSLGQGVPKDIREALKWYRMAADQGYALAQYNLGSMYAKGEGVDRDPAEALKWLRPAAEQGNDKAQFLLGGMYYMEGGSANHSEAAKWFSRAADQGNVDAQFGLGYMYAKGEGVDQNAADAVKLYRLAAEQGHKQAKEELTKMGLQ